ncbi:hypothetical protein BDQ17DRAFT_1441280 [Cyathus striatus]|nr:hypothetical protein BDQ17DRAFT_1441280 [Cyathus striatus]
MVREVKAKESTTLHHRVIPITDDESDEHSIPPPQESPTQHPDEKGSPQLQDEEDDDSVETGNGPELDAEAPGAIQCHGCKDWMHLACQRGGRRSWLPEEIDFFCDYCSKGKSYMVQPPQKGGHKETKQIVYWRGTLILVSQYWYPGRILMKVELGHETQWDVKLWRDCSIPESNQGKFLIYNGIKKSEIVDELWKDIRSWRGIQLGHWKLAINTPSEEDIIENFVQTPVTKEMEGILGPHVIILDELLCIDIQKVNL